MGLSFFLSEYVLWHYGRALLEIWELGRNYLRFGWNFFSLPLLLKTWLSPWYRMREEYDPNMTHFEALGAALLGNIVLRIVGALLRTFVIALGILFCVGVITLTIVVFCVWVLFPAVLVALFVAGVTILA